MITMPAARGTPRKKKPTATAAMVRPAYQKATVSLRRVGAPTLINVAGRRNPTTALMLLLFIASLSVAAPRPRRARYRAATAFGRLVIAASTTAPTTADDQPWRLPRSVTVRSS